MTNYSKEHMAYLKRLKQRKAGIAIGRWAVILIFIGLWELLAQTKAIDSFITSCPSEIATTLVMLFKTGSLAKHIGVTLLETVVGFLLATVLGLIVAIALWWFEIARKITEPYLVILNALPKIALGPVIIIWVGAGTPAIIVMALLISLIITIMSILQGFLTVDEGKIRLFKTMKATKMQTLTKLVLPSNIPNIMSVLKVNVGLSWVGTIMGEYLVSKSGLGYLIIYGGTVFQLNIVMTATLVLCILAALMYWVIAIIEKIVNKRYNFNV